MKVFEMCRCLIPEGVKKGDLVQARKGKASRAVPAGLSRGWIYGIAMEHAKCGDALEVLVYGEIELEVER